MPEERQIEKLIFQVGELVGKMDSVNRQIDQGFTGMNRRLDQFELSLGDQGKRIGKAEAWQATSDGAQQGSSRAVAVIAAAVSLLIGLATFLLDHVFFRR